MKESKLMIWLAVLALALGIAAIAGVIIVNAMASETNSVEETVAQRVGDVVAQSEEPATVTNEAEEDVERGIVIASVAPDGPAAEAGVARGDILFEINGEAVNTARQLRQQLATLEPGDEVELKVLHGDDERTLTATLGDQGGQAYLGLAACGSFPELEDVTILPEPAGAVIVRVDSESPADKAGLERGDRIVKIDDQELDAENDLADLVAAHKPGESVTLEIERPGEGSLELTVELGEHPDKEGVAYLGVEYQPVLHFNRLEGEFWPFEQMLPDVPFLDQMPDGMSPFDQMLPDLPHFDFGPDSGQPFLGPPFGELEQGAVIRSVADDSPAAAAGLKEGDVITAIDEEPVSSPQDLIETIAQHKPGDTIKLTVLGADEEEERQVEVTLAEHPEMAGQAYLGVTIGAFFRSWHYEGGEDQSGEQPFGEFLDRFNFDWQPREHLDWLPFDLDFDLPPELFQEVPCCSEDSAL